MKPILSLLVSNYKTYVRKYSINRGIIVIIERGGGGKRNEVIKAEVV
jgi:hypothetical protein